jgi:hypothetical protein
MNLFHPATRAVIAMLAMFACMEAQDYLESLWVMSYDDCMLLLLFSILTPTLLLLFIWNTSKTFDLLFIPKST